MKNNEILLEVIGETNEELVPQLPPKKHGKAIIKWTVAAALCAVLAMAIALTQISGRLNRAVPIADSTTAALTTATTTQPPVYTAAKAAPLALATAVYPEIPDYPGENNHDGYEAWREACRSLQNHRSGYDESYKAFFANTAPTFLSAEDSQNAVYSPMSLYMALAMCAECTGGSTRQQLLDVLAEPDIDTLRRDANGVWQTSYMDDGMAKCVLANSLWMNYQLSYNQEVLDTLANNYYTSSFSGDPASREYNELLQSWLNEQTDDLLSYYTGSIAMEPKTMLLLASTVNYAGKWENEFDEEKTEKGTFHSPDGDCLCDYMNKEEWTYYSWGSKFSAVCLRLENNGAMRLLLPDKGVSCAEMLADQDTVSYMLTHPYSEEYTNTKDVTATISVPRFDVSQHLDLTEGLQTIGIIALFDGSAADFTPLTDAKGAGVIQAVQDSRVMIDEEGCRAASLTVMAKMTGIPPDDHVTFTLDRPFVFEIVSNAGLPLFIGIVNVPTE